jgi:hypothetical protein
MARPLRIQYPGGWYHLRGRGNDPLFVRTGIGVQVAGRVLGTLPDPGLRVRADGQPLAWAGQPMLKALQRRAEFEQVVAGKAGGIDYTGVSRAVRRFEDRMRTDKPLARSMDEIEQQLGEAMSRADG